MVSLLAAQASSASWLAAGDREASIIEMAADRRAEASSRLKRAISGRHDRLTVARRGASPGIMRSRFY